MVAMWFWHTMSAVGEFTELCISSGFMVVRGLKAPLASGDSVWTCPHQKAGGVHPAMMQVFGIVGACL